MIVPARILALLRKEIAELARNRAALLPVAFVALITTALPFFIAVATPRRWKMTSFSFGVVAFRPT